MDFALNALVVLLLLRAEPKTALSPLCIAAVVLHDWYHA
jgi:hypothetical protein